MRRAAPSANVRDTLSAGDSCLAEWLPAIAQIKIAGFRGTGFLVTSDGLVLTAFHVIADRDASIKARAPRFHEGPIQVRFGSGLDDTWDGGTATVVENRFSIAEDWALLRIRNQATVPPMVLAALDAPRDGRAFTTFGFPDLEKEWGGAYHGTIGMWGKDTIELAATNIVTGMAMGGISGAPVVVDGRSVAIILRSLADDKRRAMKGSLYAVPIERAVRGCEGLLLDDAGPMPFEQEIAVRLPEKKAALIAAGDKLGLPAERATAAQIARRMLSSELKPAGAALRCCQLSPVEALPILECLGAMRLHDDAIEELRRAGDRARVALLQSAHGALHRWYVRRAYAEASAEDLRVVVVFAGDAEQEPDAPPHSEQILARIRHAVSRQVGAFQAACLLSEERDDDECLGWVIMVDEDRYAALAEAQARLPNLRIIAASTATLRLRDDDLRHVEPVSPVMTPEEEQRLLTRWQGIAGSLGILPKGP